MIANTRLILVVPAFNESARIQSSDYFSRIISENNVCILFVNDGSNDDTPVVLDSIAKQIQCNVLHLERNVGKAEALREGFLYAFKEFDPELIGFLDCDAAFSIESVSDFIAKALEKFQHDASCYACISSRAKLSGRVIVRDTSRHYISRILITFIGLFVNNLPYDSQSGLKVFRNSEELHKALSKPFKTRWFFDLELLIRTGWLNAHQVWEEPVLEWKDVAGSHLNIRKSPMLVREIFYIIKLGKTPR